MALIRRDDSYWGLVDEVVHTCKQFQSETAENYLRFKYILAQTIVHHPSYAKFSKGNRDFIQRLSSDVRKQLSKLTAQRISKTTLYDMLALYEKEPNVERAIEKAGTYTQALVLYLGRSKDSVSDGNNCKHCLVRGHCPRRA